MKLSINYLFDTTQHPRSAYDFRGVDPMPNIGMQYNDFRVAEKVGLTLASMKRHSGIFDPMNFHPTSGSRLACVPPASLIEIAPEQGQFSIYQYHIMTTID